MNEIISYFLKSVSSSTLTLKKKNVLVNKPWALIDNDGEIQKLIFKNDNGLVLSKNGQVTEGSWEYFPEARALLINRVTDKLLLNEQYIDDNVLIFKRDGTGNEYFTFANELTLPDYNVPRYLNQLKCIKFGIGQRILLSGNILQIYNVVEGGSYVRVALGHKAGLINHEYNDIVLTDGEYITKDKKDTFYIVNGKIKDMKKNLVRTYSGGTFEIEDGNMCFYQTKPFLSNISKKVTINGMPVVDLRITDNQNVIYEIKNSIITRILFKVTYDLNNGNKVTIEQKNYDKIQHGDMIVQAEPQFPLPDGSYKIKGRLHKINVRDNEIV